MKYNEYFYLFIITSGLFTVLILKVCGTNIHVIPSVIISVILQQAEMMRMLGWSTTSTFHSADFTERITSFRIPAHHNDIVILLTTFNMK